MARHNGTDWGSIIGGIAQLAIVGGATVAVFSAREAALDKLLASSTEEAVGQLIQSIPNMDEDTWSFFSRGLQTRAEQNAYAYRLLLFATDIHTTCVGVDNILDRPITQAKMLVETTVHEMNDATWSIFDLILEIRSQTDMRAQALHAYAKQARNAPLLAEELFRESLHAALADGVITASEASDLEQLRQQLYISADVARRLLSDVKAERAPKQLAKPSMSYY
jgi:hypothetical protein